MKLNRTHLVAALAIVAGGALGASDDVESIEILKADVAVRMYGERAAGGVTRITLKEAEQVTPEARAQVPLEFKLVLPATELVPALSLIDRQIVGALGVDAIRALGRDVEDPARDSQNLLRPLTSLLRMGDVEGAYLVATEDVEVTTLFLGLTEVQRALPTDVSLHWEAGLVDLGRRTYRRLYVTAREAFATGEIPDDAPTTLAGALIAVVRDGEVIATSRITGGVSR